MIVGVLVAAGVAFSAAPTGAAEPTDRERINKVGKRLLAVIEPPAGMEWPPTFDIMQTNEINAFAGVQKVGKKLMPKVYVTSGFMAKVVEGDEDRLAFVMGHELGHIVLGHCTEQVDGPDFVKQVFGRQHEIDADMYGMETALKAGFSLKGGLSGIRRIMELGVPYNSFEGLNATHPSWKERISFMDKEQSKLWRAMGAFDNGTYFLLFEQHAAAERCFREVVKEFPACTEGWANLGYAQLMQYCDALDPDDLRGFDIGQLVVGGFYRRPATLETQLRGVNEELWWEAVGSLREALRLDPNSAVARGDLGVAYLLRPSGRNTGQARKFLDEAADKARADATLHPLTRASILLNAGVADMSTADIDAAVKRYDEAEAIGKKFSTGRSKIAGTPTLAASLRYNRAILLSASPKIEDRKSAVESFERYLVATVPASAWWPLAHERYLKLCKDLGQDPKKKADLISTGRTTLRLVTTLPLSGDVSVALNEPLTDARKLLGPGREVPIVKNTKLVRVKYPERGIDLIGTENVLAICLSGPKAPELPVRATGIGTQTFKLKIGMTRDEVEKLLGDEEYDFREIDQPGHTYRFYADLGLALRLRAGKVEELAIVQIPRRRD
ncbi:MAG: M48 family metalloprotease [Planctomycetes bacterium]|nr:M48 family metalloprotease [Planctomycetota bacterium]